MNKSISFLGTCYNCINWLLVLEDRWYRQGCGSSGLDDSNNSKLSNEGILIKWGSLEKDK